MPRLTPIAKQSTQSNDREAPGALLVIAPTKRETAGARSSSAYSVETVGIGKESARALASRLKARGVKVVLSLGFAGALSPTLKMGNLTLHPTIALPQNEAGLVTCEPWLLDAARSTSEAGGQPFHEGMLLTAPRPLLTPEEKHAYGMATGALAVDMEGYWLAETASRSGVPLLAIRTVIDEANDRLPGVVEAIVADGGRNEWRHAVGALSMPRTALALAALAARSWRARNHLRQAVHTLLPGILRAMEDRAR